MDVRSFSIGLRAFTAMAASPVSLAEQLGLPVLPPLEDLSWAPGPHDTCNYLLPGRLLAGSYPGDRKEPEHSAKIRVLLESGVDTFVCLQEEQELQRFTPYVDVARSMAAGTAAARIGGAAEADGAMVGDTEEQGLEFLSCPIPDQHVTSTEALEACLATLVDKLLAGRQIYVHCWGGHGRTGTVLCGLLVRVYGLTAEEARAFYMETHHARRNHRGGHWPASIHQLKQVQSFEGNSSTLTEARLKPLAACADREPRLRGVP